jgi:hypothetical protein
MAKRLSYRVQVVLSIALVTLLISTCSLKAQPNVTPSAEITFTCQNLDLETAFEKLSQKAGVFFIYSPSVLDLNKKISFNAQRQSLNKLLENLGRELNLSFRYEGKYVIVKKGEQIARKQEVKTIVASPSTVISSGQSLMDKVSQQEHVNYLTSISKFHKLSPLEIKPSRLNPPPLNLITSGNDEPKKWFASAGLVTNNYTSGSIEFRGGQKPLYGVFNVGLLNYGRYRFGYGLGTSMRLSDALSINPIYNYALIRTNFIPTGTESSYLLNRVTAKYSQVKVVLEYTIHPRFHVNAGTSVNLLHNYHELQSGRHFDSTVYNSRGNYVLAPVSPQGNTNQTKRIWFGWEVGFFYYMNF